MPRDCALVYELLPAVWCTTAPFSLARIGLEQLRLGLAPQLPRLMIFGWVTPAAAGSNSGDVPGSMVTNCRPLGLVLLCGSTRTWAASDGRAQRGPVRARPS